MSNEYKIQHTMEDNKGVFFVEEDGKHVSEMIYKLASKSRMVIEHTEVEKSHRGSDLGKLLVFEGARFAREKGYKIIPVCPFARAIFERYEEIQDVLHDRA